MVNIIYKKILETRHRLIPNEKKQLEENSENYHLPDRDTGLRVEITVRKTFYVASVEP